MLLLSILAPIVTRNPYRIPPIAAAILANEDGALAGRLGAWREKQTGSVAEAPE